MTVLLLGVGIGALITPAALLLLGFLMIRSWLR